MSREFIVYNCKDILISFGPYSLTGLADDAFLTIEDIAEEVSPTAGCEEAAARLAEAAIKPCGASPAAYQPLSFLFRSRNS